MDVLQHPSQGCSVHLAFEPEPVRGASHPLAGRLLRPGVVLLGTSRDVVEVVLLLARRQFAEAQHGPTARGTCRRTTRHAPAGASASLFLVRVVLIDGSAGIACQPVNGSAGCVA